MSMNSSHKSEKVFLLGASVMIVTAISLLSFSTIKLHLSTQRLYVELQAQEEQFRSFERHRQNLDRATQLHENGDYDTCLQVVETIPEASPFYGQAQALSVDCHAHVSVLWLQEADSFADQGNLLQAVRIASQIQAGENHGAAQSRIRAWTPSILAAAASKFEANDGDALHEALNILSQIQPDNPLYGEAVARHNQWKAIWADHNQAWQTAQQAFEVGNLKLAQQTAQHMQGQSLVPSFWQGRWSTLLANTTTRQEEYRALNQAAENYLDKGLVDQAIRFMDQLPDYGPWIDVKATLEDRAEKVRQEKLAQERGVQNLFNLFVATLGGGGFGFLGGILRR